MNPLEDILKRYRNGSALSGLEVNRLLDEDGTGVDLAEWERLRAKMGPTLNDGGDFEAEQQAVAGLRIVFEEFGIETRGEYHEFRRQIDSDHPFKEARLTLVENVTPWAGRSADDVEFELDPMDLDQLPVGESGRAAEDMPLGGPETDFGEEDV